MPYCFRSEYPMKYLPSITMSFLVAGRAPVGAATIDCDNTDAKAVGECTDIRLDCAGG